MVHFCTPTRGIWCCREQTSVGGYYSIHTLPMQLFCGFFQASSLFPDLQISTISVPCGAIKTKKWGNHNV